MPLSRRVDWPSRGLLHPRATDAAVGAASDPPERHQRLIRLVAAITGLAVLVYLLSTILRPRNSASPFFDEWVGNIGYAGCTLLCAWRAIVSRSRRLAWAAIATSLGLFTIGAVLWTTTVQHWSDVPYPSIADVFFLAFYPVAFLGIGLLARESSPRGTNGVWLDGLIAAFGVAALETILVIGSISSRNTGDAAAVATNLAYPIGDLVLVMVVVAVFAARGWRPGRRWWVLGGGLLLFAAADSAYVVRVLAGTYVTGTPLDSLWLIGTFIIAIAAWQQPDGPGSERARSQPIVVPMLFLLSSLAIILADRLLIEVLPLGLGLATCTLLVAFIRLGQSFRQLRALADTRQQAVTDDLTGLGNRRLLRLHLERMLAPPARPLALLVVDLDRFKEINDSFGHATGDELLRAVAIRLKAVLRAEDLIARLGGDEYALVLGDGDREGALDIIERIRTSLDAPFILTDVTVHVTASIGVALAPEHGDSRADLLRCADVALYQAKESPSGVVIYSASSDDSKDRFELVEDLRRAIRTRTLQLHYQPQLDLHTGRITGVEALLRWNHPTRGPLSPTFFVLLAEQARLIGPLTDLVLDLAVAQAADFESRGLQVSTSVNVSTTNLLEDDLVTGIQERLERFGVPPERLVIEITETTLLTDSPRALEVVVDLHRLGVGISVDDFGTGYSSLAYLRDLPVDELKLDREFLAGLATDETGRTAELAQSALRLGHALGLRVLAEGVEDAETLSLLTAWGFDAAQGYHVGRPVPAGDLPWLPARMLPEDTPSLPAQRGAHYSARKAPSS